MPAVHGSPSPRKTASMTTGTLVLSQLTEQAQQATGLADFGDESWREGAERLISDLNERAALNEVGIVIAASDVVEYLTSRLRVVDWVKRNPSIADADIRPPIVVLGQPRTGTTILFDVLAQDPANRVPLTWEVDEPWPPPETATFDSDPRIDAVDAKLANVDLLIPGFQAMHDMGARLAQECVRITAGDFRSMIFSTQYRVPDYQRWLLHQADMAPAYRYHRMFLQYLQSAHPADRWVIKSPAHLWSLSAMFHEYPEALIVQTHRDPLRVVCSLASLVDLLRRLASDDVSISEVAAEWVDDIVLGLDRAMEARTDGTVPAGQAVDVLFRDFLRDPMAVVKTIYERLDIELTDAAEKAMRAFLADNPQEKHGGHRYSFAETGLDAGLLRERTRAYTEFFDIPEEALP
jgi:Sulfotransferase family